MDRFRFERLRSAAWRELGHVLGRFRSLRPVLDAFESAPPQLGLEFTNLCNADCIFCPYQFQRRPHEFMADAVFEKAVADYVALGGGEVELTPIVGDPLIHPDFVARVRYLRSRPRLTRISTITNGILLDRHGIDAVLASGLTAIFISTAGFDEAMYRRIYRSTAYQRMRRNVLDLVRRNNLSGRPVQITICLRGDRPLARLLRDPDFRDILAERPTIRSNRSYSDAGGRIRPDTLPGTIRLRVLRPHPEPCAYTYLGPSVLSDGTVVACNCLAAVDAPPELILGHILRDSLADVWRGRTLRALRDSFTTPGLNATCAACTMYQNLDALRARRGRAMARRIMRHEPRQGAGAGAR